MTLLLLVAYYVVFAWGFGLTRLVNPAPAFHEAQAALATVAGSSLLLLFLGGPIFGPVLSVASLLFSAWFAWSTRVPLFFKQFSYERLVGTKNYREEDVPDTVWKRPGFVERYWPTWL